MDRVAPSSARLVLLVLLVLTALPAPRLLAAPLAAVPESAIDAIMAPYARPDGPGCSVGVAGEQSLLFAKGYGAANVELSVPNVADTVFPIGSNSKQFTAALVALLAEDGSLDLDADIR